MAHKNIKSAYTDTQSAEQSNRKTKRLSVLHAVQQKAASSFHLQHTHMFLKQCGRTFHSVTNIALHGHLLLTKICLQHRLLKKKNTKKPHKKKKSLLLKTQSFVHLFSFKGDFVDLFVDLFEFI